MAADYNRLYNRDGAPPGRAVYHYDTTDLPDTVEAFNYFNNVTGNQNLAIGDRVVMAQWSNTPFAAGSTIARHMAFRVTNAVSRTAASNAGAVNLAQELTASDVLSSGT